MQSTCNFGSNRHAATRKGKHHWVDQPEANDSRRELTPGIEAILEFGNHVEFLLNDSGAR